MIFFAHFLIEKLCEPNVYNGECVDFSCRLVVAVVWLSFFHAHLVCFLVLFLLFDIFFRCFFLFIMICIDCIASISQMFYGSNFSYIYTYTQREYACNLNMMIFLFVIIIIWFSSIYVNTVIVHLQLTLEA